MKQANPFDIVTSIVVARSVFEPLGPSFDAQMSFADANDALISAWHNAGFAYDLPDQVSLVHDGPQVVGWYTIDMFDSDLHHIAEVMRPIHASELVAADTPVFKLVRLLTERPKSGLVLFVLEQDAIIGTISPAMLRHPVFRLCLFALSLELEEAALSAAMVNPLASWNALSEARRVKAQEVYDRVSGPNRRKTALGHKPLGPLLASTMISDKGRIVCKRKLLPAWSRSRIESLFALAEKVRNWCAHTRDSQEESPLGLLAKNAAEFIAFCTEVIGALRAIAEREEESS